MSEQARQHVSASSNRRVLDSRELSLPVRLRDPVEELRGQRSRAGFSALRGCGSVLRGDRRRAE